MGRGRCAGIRPDAARRRHGIDPDLGPAGHPCPRSPSAPSHRRQQASRPKTRALPTH
jgi:hypothetical protein